MPQSDQLPPRLLVVEDDTETRAILLTVLSEEGYAVSGAGSLDAALEEVNTHIFDLILADVIGWQADAPLQAVERLRDQAAPTPVGLLTGWTFDEREIKLAGFACLLKKPFDLDELFGRVAECVARPLSPAQAQQADVVRRYCEAIDAHDWQACVALCCDHVRYYPTPNTPFDRHQEVIGHAALLEQLEYNSRVVPDVRYDTYSLYGRPNGIAVRYRATVATPTGRAPLVGSVLFQVKDGQIAQIGYGQHTEQGYAWSQVQQKPLPSQP
jgi:CheY-like chemotaxis protein